MSLRAGASRKAFAAAAIALLVAAAAPCEAAAQSADEIPTPRVVIYPGDIISGAMLAELPMASVAAPAGAFITDPEEVVGKAAQRTLLPGQAILKIAVANPRTVRNGSEVTLFYRSGDLEITTTGMAMQDGYAGDLIRVRNDDSGVTVSGVVQKDGSVRVSG